MNKFKLILLAAAMLCSLANIKAFTFTNKSDYSLKITPRYNRSKNPMDRLYVVIPITIEPEETKEIEDSIKTNNEYDCSKKETLHLIDILIEQDSNCSALWELKTIAENDNGKYTFSIFHQEPTYDVQDKN